MPGLRRVSGVVLESSSEVLRCPGERLRAFAERVLETLGVPEADARIAADVFIEADLRGFDSHGVARLPWFVRRIRLGLVAVEPVIQIRWRTATTGRCDGGNGLGMIVGHRAMTACIARAAESGAAFLTVKGSNHFGIAGYYSSLALAHGMIGIALSNASPRVVPTGGTTGILGTNPMSVAVPRRQGCPFILDMSTSAVSSGKIDVVVRKGETVPEGWVYPSVMPFLDATGVVPMSVLQYPLGGGTLTGGHKGFGLGLLVDILSGALSGANTGSRLAASQTPGTTSNMGHFFGALQVAGFRDETEFDADLDRLVEDVTCSPPEGGVERVVIPGEPEMRRRAESIRQGVPVLPAVAEKLRQVAADLGLDPPV
jgi:LDH2 family malate/lactate/ureidoglycolate dehydrogenase